MTKVTKKKIKSGRMRGKKIFQGYYNAENEVGSYSRSGDESVQAR